MKLLKFIATAGAASRREAESLIRAGRVSIDGTEAREPATELAEGAAVTIDGEPVTIQEKRYHLVHKPKGVITTAKDTHGRPTVLDLVETPERLYPVGRLDADSSGLILLTNDGELADRLLHPRYESEKTYRVTASKPVSDDDLRKLADGLELHDGPTAPAKVKRLGEREFEITIHEGRNRQIRRMLEALGNRVAELVRVRMAILELGELGPGESRELTAAEAVRLRKHAKL